ncbi:sigma-70 family RNA polymerase sigma factor [Lentzea nigeriaca]|uniref:sigma-70 family RNA polymerase sigma factor n=1 Tax=Lentzea nigeriaca TaxID=1128665 RepID=UPI00195BACE2|nr:sigma-70 family RNA polymerase sigma factor [Lentzea nigeriaca]MBM7856298.1 RNA polymerase sigma factor (sigma-70 family) [Lentzea nigeriaca]
MTEQVDAARAGDRGAVDALLAAYLPLVYSIVSRTLSSAADVDDVVQDTMVRVVRGIGGLREPDRFRSWLVATTVNQIRDHQRWHHTRLTRVEVYDEQPDPGAEFVDRALTWFELAEQRREIEPAARWLASEDRELLSLWSIECGRHLTRGEIADALEIDAHHIAARLSKTRMRLDDARRLVRALSVSPCCLKLVEAANGWTGEPTPLWRKRFVRHVRACPQCRTAGAGLVPVERLLVGLALLALPADYPARALPAARGASQTAKPPGTRRGVIDFITTKPGLVVAGVTAVCVLGVTPVVLTNRTGSEVIASTVNGQTPSAVPTTTTTKLRVPSIVPTAPGPASTPPASQGTAAPSRNVPPDSSRLITLLNERRGRLGLSEVEESPQLVRAARACVQGNLEAAALEHCGHEVLFKGGKGTSPETMIDVWFKSEAHRTALTCASSRKAGAAIVVDSGGTLIAAINIDY